MKRDIKSIDKIILTESNYGNVDCEKVNADWPEDKGLYDIDVGITGLGDPNIVKKAEEFWDTVNKRINCLKSNTIARNLGGAYVASFQKAYIESLLEKFGVENSQVRDILSAASIYIEPHQWSIIAKNWNKGHPNLSGFSGCQAVSMALIRGAVYEVGVMTPGKINQIRQIANSRVGKIVLGIFGTKRAIETARIASVDAVFDDPGELGERVRNAQDELTEYLCGLTGIEDILNTKPDKLLDIIVLPEDELENLGDDPAIGAPKPVPSPPRGRDAGSGRGRGRGGEEDDKDKKEEEEEKPPGYVPPPPKGRVDESKEYSRDKQSLAREMIMAAIDAGII